MRVRCESCDKEEEKGLFILTWFPNPKGYGRGQAYRVSRSFFNVQTIDADDVF